MISLESFDWETYAFILLLLSPVVFITLYLMIRYPIKPQYKKGKDEKR